MNKIQPSQHVNLVALHTCRCQSGLVVHAVTKVKNKKGSVFFGLCISWS